MTEGFSLGPLFLRWNGVLIALGISAGSLLAGYEAKRRGDDPELIYYLLPPLIGWGLLGARLWHIFTPPLSSVQLGLTTGHYLTHPLDALTLWIGGLGIPGALLGGTFGLFLFSRKHDLPFWQLSDLLAPGFALAQAIGRMGNYFNQELYGLPANVPWAILIQPDHRLIGYEHIEYYHPLFAYEVIVNIINAALLLWLSRRFVHQLQAGDLFLSYLLFYSAARFLLEFLRFDVALVLGFNVNLVFFAIIFILAGIILFKRHRFAQEL